MTDSIAIVTPVFNDWDCVGKLLRDIGKTLDGKVATVHLIVVNDCSTAPPPGAIDVPAGISYTRVDLVMNVGHQRAILIGLCYCLERDLAVDQIIVMDSDGEDDPRYIPTLLQEARSAGGGRIIFAARSKRSEGLTFRLYYGLYKLVFKLLTGATISFGNFSCLPKTLLPVVCNQPNFWNHYSASVIKSGLPYGVIPTERNVRYAGFSKMNFNRLILHGLSSLSIYIEEIIVRSLKASFVVFFVLFIISLVVVFVKYFSGLAIPGWATNVFGFILNLLITVAFFNLLIILSHLHNRNKPMSSPLEFYKKYIKPKQDVNRPSK